MAKEISPVAHILSKTLYAIVFNSVGQAWDTTGTPAFETYVPGSQGDYDIAVAELGGAGNSGIYAGDFPSAILPGLYRVVVYEQAGGSPAATDAPVWGMEINWDGAAAVPLRPMPEIFGSISDAGADADDFDGNSGLSSSDDFYNGCALVFTTGALAGITRKISDYVGSSRNLQFTTAFPTSPTNGDKFVIIGRIE